MSSNIVESPAVSAAKRFPVWKPLLFLAILCVGLYWVKWDPYYHKAFVAIEKHDIGKSILADSYDSPWQAMWQYAQVYFLAIWKAAVLGIVLGSLVQILLPPDWIVRFLGRSRLGSHLVATLAALPGMMCTCCAAPVAVGLYRARASASASVTYWVANPVLNPATLVFMYFVLGGGFTLLRVVFGVVLVFGAAWLVGRLAERREVSGGRSEISGGRDTALPGDTTVRGSADGAAGLAAGSVTESNAALDRTGATALPRVAANTGGVSVNAALAAAQAAADAEARKPFLQRWLPALWQLFLSTVPVYVITVLALSLARVWLFPHVDGALGDGVLWIVFFAVVGTLFVIPTAAEIPIVQGMLALGLGTGSAGALLLTLPSVSLPSLLMMRDVLGTRLLWTVAGWVALVGVLAGLVAYWV